MTARRLTMLAWLAWLAACGGGARGDGGRPDADGADGASMNDAARTDAGGVVDAAMDAAPADSGGRDGGAAVDAAEAGPPDSGAPDAGGDAGPVVCGGGDGHGDSCADPILLPAVSATYSGSLDGCADDVAGCGEGPDAVYQIDVPATVSELWVCARATEFTPVVHVLRPCGVTEPFGCIPDAVDPPCDGSSCSRWGSPPVPFTVFYAVDATCAGPCGCPSGSLRGDYTLEVIAR